MFKNTITDVFFDLDHTLWDFEKNSALTYQKIFKENKIKLVLSDFLKVYVPNNIAFWKLYREDKITSEELRYQRLKTTFDQLGYHISDADIHVLSNQYIQYLSIYNHLFPNAIEVLDYLKSKYSLHIITNGFKEVQQRKLIASKIFSYFDQVINSETAGVKKPNPIIFKKALELARTIPEQSIMIGDSIEADIIGAKAVGFHVLHFNAHNEARHEYCDMITNLNEIKNYL